MVANAPQRTVSIGVAAVAVARGCPAAPLFLEATQLKAVRTAAAVLRIEPAVVEAQVVGIGTRNGRRPAVSAVADGIQCTVVSVAAARAAREPSPPRDLAGRLAEWQMNLTKSHPLVIGILVAAMLCAHAADADPVRRGGRGCWTGAAKTVSLCQRNKFELTKKQIRLSTDTSTPTTNLKE